MLLDQFGRPFREPNQFITPAWLFKEFEASQREAAATARVMRLRDSCGVPTMIEGARIGSTLNVRLPKRYATPDA